MLKKPRDISATLLTRDSIIIFVAGMVLFLLAQPTEFVGFNARFGLFAREMLHYGPSFFPTVYHQPYPDYPATATFLVYILAQLFGQLTPTIATIPSALAASFVMVITYRLAVLAAIDINHSKSNKPPQHNAFNRSIAIPNNISSNTNTNTSTNTNNNTHDDKNTIKSTGSNAYGGTGDSVDDNPAINARLWGWYAALLMLFTISFFIEARSISLDMYTTLITVLSFYVVYSADVSGRKKTILKPIAFRQNVRNDCHNNHDNHDNHNACNGNNVCNNTQSRHPNRTWIVPLLLIVGFCMRGPIGLVIPTAVICSYYFWARQYHKMITVSVVALIVFVLCCWLMLLAARYQGGQPLAGRVTSAQLTGRMNGNKDYPNDHTYYLLRCPVTLAVSCPLAILVVLAGFRNILTRKNSEYQFLGYLTCWVIIVIAGMSIPASKKMRYILPIVPALSLLAAYMFVRKPSVTWLAGTRNFFVSFCYIFALYGSAAIAAVLIFLRLFKSQLTPSPQLAQLADAFNYATVVLLMILSLCVPLINRRIKLTKNKTARDIFCIGAAVLCLALINIGLIERVTYLREQTHSFVRKLEALQNKLPGRIVFYRVGPDQEDVKYAVNSSRLITPGFIRSADDIFTQPVTTYFITRQNQFKKLPAEVTRRLKLLFTGKIGHKPSVVFQQIKMQQRHSSTSVFFNNVLKIKLTDATQNLYEQAN